MNYIGRMVLGFSAITFLCSSAGFSSDFPPNLAQQVSDPTQKQNYTSSISKLAIKAKSVVDAGLREFNDATLPHQAKDLRKQIVRLRDILDVFPHNFSRELKLWDDVRDGLDDGYTVVGDYKDLFDTNTDAVKALEEGGQPEYADAKKIASRRKKVLAWKEIYFADGGLAEKIVLLFDDIRELDSENIQPSKKYSDFFWGGVAALPSPRLSPAQNARVLIDAQAEVAAAEHPDVLAIKNPSTEHNELVFHDHRKRLRTIAKVCNVANSLSAETCHADAVKSVEALVVELGEIEDLIITGRHLDEDGKEKKADEAYKKAEKKFSKMKKDYEGRDMLEALSRL
ncbi:MAG: hypothetical protein RL189_2230 [Pseudomonadota bacterium]